MNEHTVSDTFSVQEVLPTTVSVEATFNQGSYVVHTDTSLELLAPYLTVTATKDDSSYSTVSYGNYALSGELTVGTSVVTVSYINEVNQTLTDTFNVTVS